MVCTVRYAPRYTLTLLGAATERGSAFWGQASSSQKMTMNKDRTSLAIYRLAWRNEYFQLILLQN